MRLLLWNLGVRYKTFSTCILNYPRFFCGSKRCAKTTEIFLCNTKRGQFRRRGRKTRRVLRASTLFSHAQICSHLQVSCGISNWNSRRRQRHPCCSMLQCVAVCCVAGCVLQCVVLQGVCCRVCVAMCVLQCVCCSVPPTFLQIPNAYEQGEMRNKKKIGSNISWEISRRF